MNLVFYISGHGFGHASRTIEIINAYASRRPNDRIVVRTLAPKWLFDLTANHPLEYHFVETDTGVAQIDSLHLDTEATVRRAREFMSTFDARVAEEADFLARERADLVVSDLPALGIAAGTAAGLPTIASGNFTWDWIYAAYPDSEDVAMAISAVYKNADIALRLPMWGGFDSFRRIIDLPFVARRSQRDPDDTRRALGLPIGARLVLISFGGYGLEGLDLAALTQLEGYVAIVGGNVPLGNLPEGLRERRGSLIGLDEQGMYKIGWRYEDVVRAVDVVVTKPGYGIIAECLANDTALLYTDRGHFVEYDVLVDAMPRFLRCGYINHQDLFAGRWQAALDALVAQPAPPECPATNGAEVAAELITSFRR